MVRVFREMSFALGFQGFALHFENRSSSRQQFPNSRAVSLEKHVNWTFHLFIPKILWGVTNPQKRVCRGNLGTSRVNVHPRLGLRMVTVGRWVFELSFDTRTLCY